MRTPGNWGAVLLLAAIAACGGRESLYGGPRDDEQDGAGKGARAGSSQGGKSGAGRSGAGGFGQGNGGGGGATAGSQFGGRMGVSGFGQGGFGGGGVTAGFGGVLAGSAGSATGGNGAGGLLGSPCSPDGALACNGAAQPERLLCTSGTWNSIGTCMAEWNCDSATGLCAPILMGCLGQGPGSGLCEGQSRRECGPDLVTSIEVELCEGRCVESGVTASCAPPGCNDGIIQADEECDDGNYFQGDSCTNSCRQAICGDNVIYEGYELCDDGAATPGDGCSVVCGWEPVSVAAASSSTCALGITGRIQCWGANTAGQLGTSDSSTRGGNRNDMGPNLPLVELGTNQLATAVFSSGDRSCAILVGGSVKCWGSNYSGALGIGDSSLRGNQSGQMGDDLPVVPLGRPALSLAIGDAHTCALLDDASVECWGDNGSGQLGIGSTDDHGDAPNEVEALIGIDLGSGLTAKALAAGSYHTCARLSDDSVKCWGANWRGELGLGDTDARGDEPGEMGDALPGVALGNGRRALEISAGGGHTCARLDDGSVKCWGSNYLGALGTGDNLNRGDQPGEMGDDLAPVDLGTGKTTTLLTVADYHNCAILNDGALKCWGANGSGALGIGDTRDRGDSPGELGDNLPAVNLGTGRSALNVSAGDSHTCALLDNLTIKCWGSNNWGQLGLGDFEWRGGEAGEMGDALKFVFVSF